MKITICIIATLIVLLVVLSVVWRIRAWPCPAWLRWLVEVDNPFFKTARAAYIIERMGIQPGMSILDAGCGPGRISLPLAGKTGTVVAMDIQGRMLDRVRHKATACGLANIEYLHAGLGAGGLASRTFDRALLVTVLGEIPRPQKALDEILASLKPGGMLTVAELILDPHFQSRGKVTRLARASGFHEKSRFGNALAFVINFAKPHEKN